MDAGHGDVVLLTLGGTISMSGSTGGVVARLEGRDLLAGVGTEVPVVVRDLRAVPSADLSFGQVLDALDAAAEAVQAGARGVVLTQGTDTTEETAFLLDLLWRYDAPLVVTGAMRNPTLPGADGPANLAAAVRVAASGAARNRGVLVVFNDEIHAARQVRKTHSTSTATFVSPDTGPVGHVVEGSPRLLTHPTRLRPLAPVDREQLAATRVALHTVVLDDDAPWLEGLTGSHHGLVVAGFGVGHVPGALAPRLGELARTMPVVLTSRTGAGSVLANTYGAVGSERDLLARGLIGGGFVHPYKARILLRLLLAAGAGRAEITDAFEQYS